MGCVSFLHCENGRAIGIVVAVQWPVFLIAPRSVSLHPSTLFVDVVSPVRVKVFFTHMDGKKLCFVHPNVL